MGLIFMATAGLTPPGPVDGIPRFVKARIGSKVYSLELADTLAKRAKGLAQRDRLPQNSGMLFLFPFDVNYDFTMESMGFPLDFIWLKNDKVVDLYENAAAGTTDVISTTVIFNKVIELSAGEIAASEIRLNDRISFETSAPEMTDQEGMDEEI